MKHRAKLGSSSSNLFNIDCHLIKLRSGFGVRESEDLESC